MEKRYVIAVHMRTIGGNMETGRFIIGNDPHESREVFEQLQGREPAGKADILHMSLVEQNGETEQVKRTMACTLQELAENTKLIIKETFRIINLP